jgi:hypothetical protein
MGEAGPDVGTQPGPIPGQPPVRDAQRVDAQAHQLRGPLVVAPDGRPVAVELVAVELDDETRLGPPEVDQ